jgi:hypothetical protein
MNALGSGMTPASIMLDTKASLERRYFYFTEWIRNTFLRNLELGCPFILPIVVAFFSKKYAVAIVTVEILSAFIGSLSYDFDVWYNSDSELKLEVPLKQKPDTKLEKILERLKYFEKKYWIKTSDMYLLLDKKPEEHNKTWPTIDNLDWIEMIGLLNELSLHIGKHFDSEEEKEENA